MTCTFRHSYDYLVLGSHLGLVGATNRLPAVMCEVGITDKVGVLVLWTGPGALQLCSALLRPSGHWASLWVVAA